MAQCWRKSAMHGRPPWHRTAVTTWAHQSVKSCIRYKLLIASLIRFSLHVDLLHLCSVEQETHWQSLQTSNTINAGFGVYRDTTEEAEEPPASPAAEQEKNDVGGEHAGKSNRETG